MGHIVHFFLLKPQFCQGIRPLLHWKVSDNHDWSKYQWGEIVRTTERVHEKKQAGISHLAQIFSCNHHLDSTVGHNYLRYVQYLSPDGTTVKYESSFDLEWKTRWEVSELPALTSELASGEFFTRLPLALWSVRPSKSPEFMYFKVRK